MPTGRHIGENAENVVRWFTKPILTRCRPLCLCVIVLNIALRLIKADMRRTKSMGANEMLQRLGESLGSTASVKSVFGDPIQVGEKTVVPVASVTFGFGGGFGSGRGTDSSPADGRAEGGGGGGGLRAVPAGALEITESQTRFIPFHDTRWLAGAFAAGVLLGAFFSRRAL
jgi:uncharacterized spore protein YtfJ